MKCTVAGCESLSDTRGMCRKHYTRWQRHGDPSIVKVYSRKTIAKRQVGTDYIQVRTPSGEYKFEHVVMAERALGKPLPEGAVVHHMDRDGTNNNTKTPWNLVVCPDQGYHLLLHARARALGYEPLRKSYKLNARQEAEIRASKDSREILAQRYSVTVSTIKWVRSERRSLQRAKLGLV